MVKEEVKVNQSFQFGILSGVLSTYGEGTWPVSIEKHHNPAVRCIVFGKSGDILQQSTVFTPHQWGLELVFLLFQITENCDSGVALGIYFLVLQSLLGRSYFPAPPFATPLDSWAWLRD